MGENQNDQSQEKKSGGGIGQGINTVNKLARGGIKNPFGKIGQRVVVQAGSRILAFLLGSGLPIVVVGIILLLTLIIVVGFGGAPSSGPNDQITNPIPTETITPTVAPIEAATPSPAELL